jgi:diguanylate cyclase (GGDEF)-like protein
LNTLTDTDILTAAPAYAGPERRHDLERRQGIAEMSREELVEELLVDRLTGSLSARAFEDAESAAPCAYMAILDLDSLKFVNDHLGHQAGDSMLQTFVLSCFQERSLPYRVGGDEFCIRFRTEEDRDTIWRRLIQLDRRFRNAAWAWRGEDGETRAATGAGCSFGFGETREQAEAHLRAMKEARQKAGLRAARGCRPRSLRLLCESLPLQQLLCDEVEAA